ncbi:hypothetical protein WJX73_005328 [Symbiochloris irregularis]|uniref:TCTP domain-containing protein n=1 Tax=Symbiochloris irregularis TaxID=706552 RepID=A0AAW1NVK9_9CHLO
MIIFKDVISGDELLSDSFEMKEVQDGFFYEVDGKWVVRGDTEVDIGANPSAEEADEGVEASSRKVVDLIDGFGLNEQPGYDKKLFMGYVKPWLGKVVEKLPEDQATEFKTKAQPAIKYLISKIKDLQFFTGESMDPDATLVYAYYKEGASEPTFLYPKYAMTEMKC